MVRSFKFFWTCGWASSIYFQINLSNSSELHKHYDAILFQIIPRVFLAQFVHKIFKIKKKSTENLALTWARAISSWTHKTTTQGQPV